MGGSSPYSNNILRIQKGIIRIISNSSRHESCRQLYQQQQILTVYGQYIYSLIMFVVNPKMDIHDRNNRYNHKLHFPSTNLKLVQSGVFYSGVKIFNHFPSSIKRYFRKPKCFKIKLRNFLTLSQNFVIFTMFCVSRLTYRSFMSSMMIL